MPQSGAEAWDKKIPWWEDPAIVVVNGFLRPHYCVFEWGSGGSTIWFAQRSKRVISVEHTKAHRDRTQNALEAAELDNVELRLLSLDGGKYVECIREYPDEFFDLISIDGRQRVLCLEEAVLKVRPGGLLVFDDSQRTQYREAMRRVESWPRIDYTENAPSGRHTTLFEKM